ncbi:MAG: hypothetical protein IJK22_06015 [Bacteroidales bacterium]|nr:hypothetical protein [Bacteroidales bacterium]
MGKTDFNGLSQWTGRIGGLVFKVVNGKQVITSYKKEVFNPRTEAQMLNRAKFGLAGMINKIVPKEVLVGMSSDGAESSSDDGYAYTLMMRSDEGSYRYGRSQYLTTVALG